jgi:hypothetical protein
MTRWSRQAARIGRGALLAALSAGVLLTTAVPSQAAQSRPAATAQPAKKPVKKPPVTAAKGCPANMRSVAGFGIEPTPEPGLQKQPEDFSLTVIAGKSYVESVSIANCTATKQKFWLYAADAYTLPKGGSFAVEPLNHRMRDVGTWVSQLPTQLVIPALEQANLRFVIQIPDNATPGVHAGGIVVESQTPHLFQVNPSLRIKSYTQLFSRVYLTVEGQISPGFAVSGITVSHPVPPVPLLTKRSGAIAFTVSNTGNVIIAPQAKVTVSGMFGTSFSKTYPITGQILPGSHAQLAESWTSVPSFGPVHVNLTVTTAYGITKTYSYSYLALPLPFTMASVVIIFLIIAAIIMFIRRRLRAKGAPAAKATGSRRKQKKAPRPRPAGA